MIRQIMMALAMILMVGVTALPAGHAEQGEDCVLTASGVKIFCVRVTAIGDHEACTVVDSDTRTCRMHFSGTADARNSFWALPGTNEISESLTDQEDDCSWTTGGCAVGLTSLDIFMTISKTQRICRSDTFTGQASDGVTTARKSVQVLAGYEWIGTSFPVFIEEDCG